MLCTVKVRLNDSASDAPGFDLLITAKHAVGGAGGFLSDEQSYATSADLVHALERLGVSGELLSSALEALEQEGASGRWLTVGTAVQVPFEALEAEGFYLEERT